MQRRIKRGRFSSLLSSDEETETGDESDISSYTPSRPHHTSNAQPTSSHSTGLEADTSDDGEREFTGGRSRTVSDGCHLRAAEMARKDHQRKACEARAREASQAIPHSMETILGERRPAHRARVGRELEGKEGVKMQGLS